MVKKRVVITGMGLLTPLGRGLDQNWQAILAGKSGVGRVESFDTTEYSTKIWAQIQDTNFDDDIPAKDSKKMDMFTQYALIAANEAIENANITPATVDLNRVGVAVGAGIGGIKTISDSSLKLNQFGPKKVSPFFIPAGIINMASGQISIRHNLKGPNISVVTACTTGTHNIGMAARLIAYGDADLMVAGGTEMTSTPLCLAGFSAVRALSKRNDEPEKASRPWDKDRDGFVMGEGAGILVLESYEHAQARGADILAEVIGFGMSGDAYHITAPDEDADGACRAMQAAIDDAGIDPTLIDYINAHGTSTPLNDINETKAIKKIFGNYAYEITVSSTKSMTGHLLGAAGAVEAIYSVLAIRDEIVPPTINLDNPDDGCDLDYAPHKAKPRRVDYVLSNSLGFGGTNGTLIFKKA